MGAGGGEEKELGVPGEKLKERVAGEGGGTRDEQEEQVVLGNSSASDGNALHQVGDSGKEGSPLQLVAEEGLTDG